MNKRIAFCLGFVFFSLGLLTLPHYGINWDTVNHLPRGQAYLRYLLWGKKDYSELPKFFEDYTIKDQWYWQKPESLFIDANLPFEKVPQRSTYQITDANLDFYVNHVPGGHPPISDILSSVFNRVLFGQLRLINDIDAYRVYGVFLSACLVGLLFYWLSNTYGRVAGLLASLSLSLYPLFWSESHFNTEKDVPETVFWSFFIYSLWKGVRGKNVKWILTSGVFFGLALGTKFNILFSAFIIVPWFIFLLITNQIKISEAIKNISFGIIATLIGVALFIGTWPYLWTDPIAKIGEVFNFYKGIGASGAHNINWYPLQWITYTTPLVILSLFMIGVGVAIYKIIKHKDDLALLILLWFMIPILREIAPGASFYGGIRQIMEYIPAMAIIAGLGAQAVYNRYTKKVTIIFLAIAFVPITLKLISIHPNENVYFNPLIGGLSGAKAANIPYWGFSFGAAYRQGVIWLNGNAEKDAHIVYAYELIPNFPRLWLRPDLNLHNSARSGYLRQGEYAMTLMYQGIENRSYYEMYLRKFLKPVYEVKVDGVSILTIWKNDETNLIRPWKEKLYSDVIVKKTPVGLRFRLGEARELSRLEIRYSVKNCTALTSGYVELSQDGEHWNRLPEVLPEEWRIAALGEQPKDGYFVEPFVGQPARDISVSLTPEDTCLRNITDFKLYVFN